MTPRLVVLGGGVSGLAAARAAAGAGADVLVLEASHRVGGLVETERTPDGFVVEHGADCIVMMKPGARDCVQAVGERDDLVSGGRAPRRAFVATGGGLVALPPGAASMGPGAALGLMRTGLLSPLAKARMAFEPFMRADRGEADESVADFVTRRFGREMLTQIVEPLLYGIYGAPADELSVETCLPTLRSMERKHGSVAWGMQKALRARRASASSSSEEQGILSLRRGLGGLPAAMAEGLTVRTGAGARGLRRGAGRGFVVDLGEAGSLEADAVVLATPAPVTAALLEGLAPELASALHEVPHGAVDVVSFAWSRQAVPHALDGTGFVVADRARFRTRACTWASEKWPDRAPEGQVLMRSVLSLPEASDEELRDEAVREVRELMGIEAAPERVWTRRRRPGLPLYAPGSLARADRLDALAEGLEGLGLAGNYFRGIGIPDCVRRGAAAASRALASIDGAQVVSDTGVGAAL